MKKKRWYKAILAYMLPMMAVSLDATAQSVDDVSGIQDQTDSVTISTKIWDS